MNSNMSMAVICMVNNTEVENGTIIMEDEFSPYLAEKVNWSEEDQGRNLI
jgi:hypothetical protein